MIARLSRVRCRSLPRLATGGSSRGEEAKILPAAPAHPAMFRLTSADERRAFDEARASGDSLLLAVLYARAGMEREAREELQRLAAENPQDPAVRALIAREREPVR